MIGTLSRPGLTLPFSDQLPQAQAAVPSVWASRIAWILLLPLVFFAAGGFPLTQNNPEVLTSGADSILTAPGYEPFGRELQTVVWAFVAAVMVFEAKPIAAQLKKSKWLLALILYIFLSSFWADNVGDSLRRGFLCNLTLLLGVYLSTRFNQRQQLELIFGIGVFSVIGSFLTAALLPQVNFGFGTGWQGIFGNKNDLGMFLFFFLSPTFFLPAGLPKVRIFRTIIVALGVILMGLSQSRGGWIVVLVFFAYTFFGKIVNRFERRSALLLVTIGVPLAAGAVLLLFANLNAIAYALGKDPGLSNRTLIWSAVWPSILKRPLFGYGYGGFWNGLVGESGNIILLVGTSLVHAHNGILNIWLELGLVGVLLALFITTRGAERALACLSIVQKPYFLWYGAVLLMTIVGNLDESFFLRQNLLTTSLWALACIELDKIASGERT